MQDWVRRQLDAGWPALKGSAVAGTLRIREELLNEVLSELMRAAAVEAGPSSGNALPLDRLLPFVTRASLRAEPGVLVLDFEIRV